MKILGMNFTLRGDKKTIIREVIYEDRYLSFATLEAVSQILDKVFGAFGNVVVASNNVSYNRPSTDQVNKFLRKCLNTIYLNELEQGEVFIGVRSDGELYISDEETPYRISSTLFTDKAIKPIDNMKAAIEHYQSTIQVDKSVIENSGIQGLFTPRVNSIDGGYTQGSVKDKLDSDINNNGLMTSQKKFIVTNVPYDLVQPQNELATLDFSAKQKQTFLTLCDKFGAPKELFAISEQSTFENRKLAKIDFYTNTIIPYVNKVLEQVNAIYKAATGIADNYYIDLTLLPELAEMNKQSQLAAQASATALLDLFSAGIITAEEVRSNIGEFIYLNNEKK